MYHRLVNIILRHLGNGQLVAGPDCPEVYFLSAVVNPSGTLFDFFSADEAAAWSKGRVIVLNYAPHFSPRPSEALVEKLRLEFPYGEQVGHFEVRWRQ